MIDIKFEIDGKSVDPDNISDAIEKVALQGVAKYVINKLGSLQCEEHGEAPRITVKGKSLDDLSFEVSGCCEPLIKKVKQKFAN